MLCGGCVVQWFGLFWICAFLGFRGLVGFSRFTLLLGFVVDLVLSFVFVFG